MAEIFFRDFFITDVPFMLFEAQITIQILFGPELLGNAQKLSKSAKIANFKIFEISAWDRFFGLNIGQPM